MPLSRYTFQPGINKEGTSYSNEGGWFDCDKIRFRAGRPEKIGGWAKNVLSTFLGTCRRLHQWVALNGDKFIGLGTNLKLYIKQGSAFYDITPIRSTTSAGDVTFSATNGDATITVTDSSHGAVVNDFVTFSGAATLGGLITAAVLNQEYQIASIVNANSYTIEAKDTDGDEVTANSSDSGNGGSSVVGAYQLNTGLDSYVSGFGYGSGYFGESSWGGGTSGFSSQLRLWTIDNFGEDMIANPRGGGLFYWDKSSGVSNRAVNFSALSGAADVPTIASQVIV